MVLRDLILALAGFPGELFVEERNDSEPWGGAFVLNKDIREFHESERTLLNKLVILGFWYNQLQYFIQKVHSNSLRSIRMNMNERGNLDFTSGLYLNALCKGLDDILHEYRAKILELEKVMLEEDMTPISYCYQNLDEYRILFPVLLSIVDTIQTLRLRGGSLLSFLMDISQNGDPTIHHSISHILKTMHTVFYGQLTLWMSDGTLSDPYNDFFICTIEKKNDKEEVAVGSRDTLNISIASNYWIDEKLLPSYISKEVALKILFIGVGVHHSFATSADNSSQTKSQMMAYHLQFRKQLLMEVRKLENLTAFDFDVVKLDEVISDVRQLVASYLANLLLKHCRLLSHLEMAKNFFLLGRGEIFASFIEEDSLDLLANISKKRELDLNKNFRLNCLRYFPESETLFECFQLRGKDIPADEILPDCPTFDFLHVDMIYNPKKPLDTVFTRSSLLIYGQMFRLLLSLKFVQMELQSIWIPMTNMFKKEKRGDGRYNAFMELFQLRSKMQFFIDNLQFYLQADVLEPQYNWMIQELQHCKDYEHILEVHQEFLQNLLSNSLLRFKAIATAFRDIILVCHSFYTQFLQLKLSDPKVETSIRSLCATSGKEFSNNLMFVFRTLSFTKSALNTPQMGQLLLRLDFNGFLSRSITK